MTIGGITSSNLRISEKALTYNRNKLYLIGLLLAIAITSVEFARGRHLNFMVFAQSTVDFWNNINPYTNEWRMVNPRYFLYSPVFSVLFTPFAYLPSWLGPFAWNAFNFTLFFASVFSLPERFNNKKNAIFLFLLPILAQSMFSFQYNVVVAYLFLFAFSLLERDKSFWAILLIMVSGLTKVYGIFELALLFCYPRFWKNAGYAILCSILLLALPLLKIAPQDIIPYYGSWLDALEVHQTHTTFDSFFFAQPFAKWLLPNFRTVQIGSLIILAAIFLSKFKSRNSFAFRAQSLGILMSWVILMSDSAEKHTYVIALAGYMLWYYTISEHTKLDKCLFWANFILLCIVPIDVFCPVAISSFITRTLWLHVWVFFITWIRMVYTTFFTSQDSSQQAPLPSQQDTKSGVPRTLDIICPCYNPRENFIKELSRCHELLKQSYPHLDLHLIVANDGSARNFGAEKHEELRKAVPGVEIADITHAGKGAAVRAGMALSKGDYTIYTDIDMPYKLESVCQVIDKVLDGCDVVIAVRNASYHTKLSRIRKVMSYGSKVLNKLFLNMSHTDTQGGLKGLSPRAREVMLKTRTNGFLFDTEFVAMSSRDGLTIESIETSLRDGIIMSHMSWRVMFGELRNFLRIAFTI